MTKQMNLMGGDRIIGHLIWWSLRLGEFDLGKLERSAQSLGVPTSIIDRLSARDKESAFKAATQLGAAGAVIGSNGKMLRRIVTRNAMPGDSKIRALVLEVTDPTGRTEEWVTSKTACTLSIKYGQFEVEWAGWVDSDPSSDEIRDLVEGMRSRMWQIIGRIDDGRIRAALLHWLSKKHRITVRGAGGVYLIPCSQHTPRQDMERDLLAIRDWLKTINSPFSVVAINETGCHSIEDFIEDAVSEVKAELQDIAEKIKKWEQNSAMNAGSRNYSAGTQIERMVQIEEKIESLKEALGLQVGTVDNMTQMIRGRLEAMIKTTAKQIEGDHKVKLQKRKAKYQEKKGKKAGTSQDRKKRRAI